MYQQLLQGTSYIRAPLCTDTAPLGDPIEVSALGQGLTSRARGDQPVDTAKAQACANHLPLHRCTSQSYYSSEWSQQHMIYPWGCTLMSMHKGGPAWGHAGRR